MLGLLRLPIDIALATPVALFALPWCWRLLQRTWNASARGWPATAAPDETWLLVGLGAGLLLVWWRRPNRLLHTALHEAAHAIVCTLLLVRVGSIHVSAGAGGEVRHAPVDPIRRIPILIAPYVLPLIAGPLLLARWLCWAGTLRCALTALCGWALLAHLDGLRINVVQNWRGAGSDLVRAGRLLSLALIACGLLLLAAAAVHVLFQAGPPGWWLRLFRYG